MTDHAQEEAQAVIDKVFNEQDIRKACQPHNTFVEYLANAIRRAEKRGRDTIEKELMAELRDPNGTIWEHAKRLQDENDALKADRLRILEEVYQELNNNDKEWMARVIQAKAIIGQKKG